MKQALFYMVTLLLILALLGYYILIKNPDIIYNFKVSKKTINIGAKVIEVKDNSSIVSTKLGNKINRLYNVKYTYKLNGLTYEGYQMIKIPSEEYRYLNTRTDSLIRIEINANDTRISKIKTD